jgi:hypothetical protein
MRKHYHPDDMTRLDRYLALNAWLKHRYSEDGWITLSIGGVPTLYSRLDLAFFHRYITLGQ